MPVERRTAPAYELFTDLNERLRGFVRRRIGDSDAAEELARCLEPLIRRLPEPYREALTLTDLGELSQVEAARVAGLSVPGMKARVQRARAQVHKLLTACCDVALDDDRQIAEVRRTGPCACAPE